MAAVFGSSTRATFASIVFAFEMTQSYNTILPVMFASVVADVVATRLMPTSILTEQLRRSGVLVHHEYEADVLAMVPVGTVMTQNPVAIPHTMLVREVLDRIDQGDPELTRHQALLLLNENQQLCGIVTRGDLIRAVDYGQDEQTVLEVGTAELVIAYPDESVRTALDRMVMAGIGRMPVVDRQEPTRLLGYLSRANVIAAHQHRLRDDEIEVGWIERRLRSKAAVR